MKSNGLLNASERWFRLLLRLYPPDFRDEMGEALVETYVDRTREASKTADRAPDSRFPTADHG